MFGLDRRLGALCRYAARRIAEGCPAPGAIGLDALVHWYGEPPYRGDDVVVRTQRAGVAVGLAATVAGGEVLFVEARTVPGSGRLRVTGALVWRPTNGFAFQMFCCGSQARRTLQERPSSGVPGFVKSRE